MTLELFFVGASFVVGVSQMAEAWVLLREGGKLRAAVAASSALEFVWVVFCVYLLVTGRLEYARWLAMMFLVYFPVAIFVSMRTDPDLFRRTPETLRVPKVVAWMGGAFGAAYALGALVLLAR